jgi:hypothetical protein
VAMHLLGQKFQVGNIMNCHSKAFVFYKKGARRKIAAVFNPAVPLAFILYKFYLRIYLIDA